MKKLVLLLSALIMGLVLVSCEVSVTPLTDWVILTNSTYSPMEIGKGSSGTFDLYVDATEYISKSQTSVTISSGGSTVTNSGITVSIPEFNSMDTTVTVTVAVSSLTAAGTYTVRIDANGVGDSDYTTVSVVVAGTPATITSVENASLIAGGSTTTTAVIVANDDVLTTSSFTVTFPSSINTTGTAPTATVSAYANGVATISIDGSSATEGSYTGTLTLGTDTENFTVTVSAAGTALTEKALMLYNPYAKDGFNSAYNLVSGDPVAGETGNDGKMVYAKTDSALADLAVDNTFDIRDSKIVTELTSINGGLFKVATTADYDNATDVSLRALCGGTAFTDNEAIEFGVGSVYAMQLASARGYVVFKITSFDDSDASSGSTTNTGAMGIAYKYVSVN